MGDFNTDAALASAPGLRSIDSVDDNEVVARTHDGQQVRIDRGTFDRETNNALGQPQADRSLLDGALGYIKDNSAPVIDALGNPVRPFINPAQPPGSPDVTTAPAPGGAPPPPSAADVPAGAVTTRSGRDAPLVGSPEAAAEQQATAQGADPSQFTVGGGAPGGQTVSPYNSMPAASAGAGGGGAHMANTGGSTSTVSGTDISQQQAQIEQGVTEQKQAATDVAAAQAAGLAQQAQVAAAAAKQLEDITTRRQAVADASRREQDRMFTEIKSVQAEVAGGKVDPNHLWSSKSAGQKIGTVLAVLLSGLGAGMSGTPGNNMALKMLEDDIDRDIDAQKANLANKRGTLSDKVNALGVARTITHDQLESLDTSKILMLEATKSKLTAIGNNTDSEVVKANVSKLMGDIDERTGALRAELAMKADSRVTKTETQKLVGGGGAGRHAISQQGTVDFGQYTSGKDGSEKLATYVPSIGAFATSKEDANAMKTTSEQVTKMRGIVRQIEQLRDKHTGGIPDSAMARASALATQLQLTEKNRQQLGALSGSDLQMLESYLPSDPLAVLSYNKERMADFDAQLAQTLPNMVESRGAIYATGVPKGMQRSAPGEQSEADKAFQARR